MWADNEADADLLGFEFLIDGLVVALTEPRLLPLTIGVLGDWGSGKSSLMQIAAQELKGIGRDQTDEEDDAPGRYLVINFSPWQYEDHDDVKIALMSAVLDAIAARVPGAVEEVGRLRTILGRLGRWGRQLGRTAAKHAPAVVPILVQQAVPEMDADTADLISAATSAVSEGAQQALAELVQPRPSAGGTAPTPTGDVDAFRKDFAKLVKEIPGCDAVIVFIDDLDRCLPETVVDTFEAIRLFLNTPKTAYVMALNQNVVESAIDSRYPELKKPDGAGIGRDYLEKMLQLKIAIPPLSAPEAETYVNLLFAELHLDEEQLDKVLEASAQVRRENGLAVAFNAGIAGEALGGDIPLNLAADLSWAADITPILGASLRGNPRQLKRFLNNLLLKHRSAIRRNASLKLPVLAKLMVLEDQYNTDFQKLFDWELAAGGACGEIRVAEARVRATGDSTSGKPVTGSPTGTAPASRQAKAASSKPETTDQLTEAQTWADKTHIAEWLRAEPAFAGIDLRPYFTYSRDKLSFGVSASRLAPHLQRLITDVQSDVDANRRRHIGTVADLEANERAQFTEALLERVQRHPGSFALTAALELAEKNPDMVPAVCRTLQRIPPAVIPPASASAAVRRLPADHADVAALLDRWEASEHTPLKTVVTQMRKASNRAKGGPGGNVR
ncbi:KAP family P-loop NTPase fold protein [Arthrobacter sp. Soil762]|uniref:KAP family P-loop NTPase fold protein n=1 Tax=Arthrobacter sp. Soil762 TaxID=1736401 RepID=UPI0007023B4A|nr:P-loop NTPase fold protein [Arthrobacter sp. Soil762]KRE72752.1 hypothetical protein ASG77_08800 [Arthrobacter sp. Soil762]